MEEWEAWVREGGSLQKRYRVWMLSRPERSAENGEHAPRLEDGALLAALEFWERIDVISW